MKYLVYLQFLIGVTIWVIVARSSDWGHLLMYAFATNWAFIKYVEGTD